MKSKVTAHLMRHPNGGWQGKKTGAQRASIVGKTKRETEIKMKNLIRRQGGGELRIHNIKNRIIDSDTIAPANDPFPPRDRKH